METNGVEVVLAIGLNQEPGALSMEVLEADGARRVGVARDVV
eukprot:CAMPEP_0183457316 /NCGR_PEP_ID=MMETSP0370-20130417/131063_1 /TAXON_ID=268820 /ORGANISM="Peridinium aciculiferum, Strain PAER-2" /LENGTH=41 /DNA_ID= /DNA_START= /DNA_END= /DNA_ORIENTATION=